MIDRSCTSVRLFPFPCMPSRVPRHQAPHVGTNHSWQHFLFLLSFSHLVEKNLLARTLLEFFLSLAFEKNSVWPRHSPGRPPVAILASYASKVTNGACVVRSFEHVQLS
jgi:hypothetical protein